MARLWKYCPSLALVFCISCQKVSDQEETQGRRAEAEQIFKEALQYYQGTPDCMRLIEESILIDTTYAEAIRELSVPYLKRGLPHKWKPLFDRAVHHDPKTWLMARGVLYLKTYRDYKKAIEDLDAADALTPDFVDYTAGHSIDYWRGMAYLGLKDYKSSIHYYDKHIKKETEETGEDWVELEAFLYRGIAYYEMGNHASAKYNFNKMLQYSANSADAKYYLSKIFSENGQVDSAKNYIKGAKKDFELGFYNRRNYVEALRQIYWEDLEELEKSLDE